MICVWFDVLGPLRLDCGVGAIPVSGVLRRHLLAMLLVRGNRPVAAEALTDALWGAHVDDATTRLHLQVHRLRGILDEPSRLTSDASGYWLHVDPEETDAGRFDALVDEADRDPGRTAPSLREALGLWRGEPYAGLGLPEVEHEAHRLSERRLDALESLYTAELCNGRYVAVASELGETVRRHPLRERLHVLLMTALYRAGRRADALAAYRRARELLVDELGVEPGPELRHLEHAVLDGAPVELDRPTPPIVVPAQLPHRPAGFVGRSAQLSALDGLLRPVAPVSPMAVVGGGGVGKTSLVLSWAHRAKEHFPDGQLYVDLRGYGPDRPMQAGDVLAGFLRALGADGRSLPEGTSERASRFRSLTEGRHVLVVLDDAHSAEQVRPLLPGSQTCRVVITSRDSLGGLVAREGAHRIGLERLTEHEATGLLTCFLGGTEHSAPEALTVLGACCAGLPLALRIAVERLRDRPRDRIDDLVTELSDARTRLDALDSGDEHTSVRAVFEASYRHLPSDAARAFRLFGIHPGHDVDASALAALAGTDRRTAQRLIEMLVRAHLVEESAHRQYFVHSLLRAYAAELTESTDSDDASSGGNS